MPAPSSPSPVTVDTRTVRVWDLPTRLFHWALAASVIGLVATAKTGAMDWHFRLGYAVMALLRSITYGQQVVEVTEPQPEAAHLAVLDSILAPWRA